MILYLIMLYYIIPYCVRLLYDMIPYHYTTSNYLYYVIFLSCEVMLCHVMFYYFISLVFYIRSMDFSGSCKGWDR